MPKKARAAWDPSPSRVILPWSLSARPWPGAISVSGEVHAGGEEPLCAGPPDDLVLKGRRHLAREPPVALVLHARIGHGEGLDGDRRIARQADPRRDADEPRIRVLLRGYQTARATRLVGRCPLGAEAAGQDQQGDRQRARSGPARRRRPPPTPPPG